jgi:hypothetical protein
MKTAARQGIREKLRYFNYHCEKQDWDGTAKQASGIQTEFQMLD